MTGRRGVRRATAGEVQLTRHGAGGGEPTAALGARRAWKPAQAGGAGHIRHTSALFVLHPE